MKEVPGLTFSDIYPYSALFLQCLFKNETLTSKGEWYAYENNFSSVYIQ